MEGTTSLPPALEQNRRRIRRAWLRWERSKNIHPPGNPKHLRALQRELRRGQEIVRWTLNIAQGI